MKHQPKQNCPLNKFKPCKQFDCGWYIQVRGVDPNTGQEVDDWGCAMQWLPVLMIENSSRQRETAASVQSFRNEVVSINEANALLAFQEQNKKEQQPKLIDSKEE